MHPSIFASKKCDHSAFRTVQRSYIDTLYQMDNDDRGLLIYYGFEGSIIRYNSKIKTWLLTVEHRPSIQATCGSSYSTFLLGNHEWRISNDTECFSGETEVKTLSFSSCSDDEYTCDDGLCVDLVLRCDGKFDCDDSSDEFECTLLEENKAYKKILPPPPKDENGTKIEIEISIDVIYLEEIDEISSSVSFQYILQLVWFEGRVRYKNLKRKNLNLLQFEEISSLWIPRIIFFNTQNRLDSLLDVKTIVKVHTTGEPVLEKNLQVFEGSENPIDMSRFYRTSYTCNFDMAFRYSALLNGICP